MVYKSISVRSEKEAEMKEEEGGKGYMSPLVKQDLANLEKEGECRRIAWDALKHVVEKLEPGCVPKFLAQVSESKETGGSRSYAISLYEEVARVHGKLIIPQIGRVMATVTKKLSASGSSPQLHQACAKVVSALVRYSIDLETSPAEAEEILREVSEPLVEVLAGKLEHVAAGAATCMQALVESEKWKHAPMELLSEVCHKTTTALGDKSTRTVAHVQLAISLAINNPGILSVYGACLLHVGEEVLNGSANSWQLRKYAAKMVQAVVAIVDKDTLALELSSIMQVLENCRHDRMPHVRTAVCEALQTAKRLATEDNIRHTDEGDHPVPGSKFSEACRMTPRRRSCSSNKFSPNSQESHVLSYSPPSMATDSETSLRHPSLTPAGMGSTGRTRRSPLFPHIEAAPSLPSSTVDKIDALSRDLDAKENVPSQIQGVNGIITHQDSVLSGIHMGKYIRPRAAMLGSYIPLPPSLLETSGGATPPAGFQVHEKEVSVENNITPSLVTEAHPRGRVVSLLSPLEAHITQSFGEAEGDLMAEDEDILSGGSAELTGRFSGRNWNSIQGGSRHAIASLNLRQDSNSPESMVHSECIQSASESNRSVGSNYSDANELCQRSTQSGVSSSNGSGMGLVENGRLSANDLLHVGATGKSQVGDSKAGISHAEYVKLGSLSSNIEDSFSALKPRVLLTAADFLPFTTPRRLVRSLQSELSSPDMKCNVRDQEGSGRVDEDGLAEPTEFNGDADMDVESSSDAGWSVRDNPVASDESFQSEASFEEEPQETFLIPQKVPSVNSESSCKAVDQKMHSVVSGLDHARTPNSGKGDDIGTYRLTPKSFGSPAESPAAELACSSCTDSQRKRSSLKAQEWDLGMDIDKECDEKKTGARRSMLFEQDPREAGFSQTSEASVTGSVYEDGREDQGASAVSNGSVSEGWWSRRLGQSSLVSCAKSSCLRMSCFAEIVLGGSLCAVIALPVAMVMARALGTQSDCFLVPT